jgi:PAS domain S-box-containing protein
MPFLYWLDVAALGVSLLISAALFMMVLGSGPRRALNRTFALFALAGAAWSTVSLLLRLSLWLKMGNPALLLELTTLALVMMGPALLAFAVRYVGREARWIDIAALVGLAVIAVFSIPLFSGYLLFNPRLHPNGSTYGDVTPVGMVAAVVPGVYLIWSLILFWQERRRTREPFLVLSVLILTLGFIVGGVLEVQFPVLSVTNLVSVSLLGLGIVTRQLFNPLRDLNAELEGKVEARTQELAHAYEEVEKRVEERTAELRHEIDERERMAEALRRQTAQLEALRQIGLELAGQLDLDTLLQSIVSRAMELLGGQSGGFYFYRPEQEVLEWVTAVGPEAQPPGSVLHRGEGLSGRVWDTGKPLWVEDYRHWEGRARIYDRFSWKAIVAAPVSWGDEFLGVLTVEAPTTRAFSVAEVELLASFATQAAMAIRNARLIESARRRAEHLAVVNHIASAVSTTLQLDDLLEVVYREVQPIFSADSFFIALYDEGADELDFRVQVDEAIRLPAERQSAKAGLTSEVIAGRNPLLIHNLAQEQERLPTALLWGTMKLPLSWLGVPMQVGERLIGVICVQSYTAHAYGEEEQQLLSTIADQVAVAVEKAQLYQTLRDSEEKYRTLFEQANDAVFLETLDGRVLDVNERACDLLGYERQELLRLTVADFLPPEIDGPVRHVLQSALATGGARIEGENVRKDGSRVPVEVSTALLEMGGQQLVLALVRDVTERKRAEEQLRQAQKMEAIGTLAGGIAHDFNNIMTGILGYATLLQKDFPPGSPFYADISAVIASAGRASDLTRQLLTFARRSSQDAMQPVALNTVVQEVVGLLERTIDKAITIELHLGSDLPNVRGDAGQLHQVFLNLCLNARDAMPNGGQLIIKTSAVRVRAEEVFGSLNVTAGEYVVLDVIDTGVGMEPAIRERIFEPFFTTKEQGRGLGLAIAYGIVRGHGGAIHVYSEPGEGTSFKVYLPAYRVAAEVAPAPREVAVGGSETILVVDDEEAVRSVLLRILERAGYTVIVAAGGHEALEIYGQRHAEIGLVILDVIMPQMGGRETYERMREIAPQVRVLLSSGYSESGKAADILAAGAKGFLQKPFGVDTVLEKVRRTLDTY